MAGTLPTTISTLSRLAYGVVVLDAHTISIAIASFYVGACVADVPCVGVQRPLFC
jgi:hypothetical protein